MDVLDLARLQFAGTTSIHWLFVILTMGLAPLVAVMHTRAALARDPQRRAVWHRMTLFWGQLYIINYAVGIVSGIVIEFQFGLSWSGLSRFAGNVFGAPLALETLIAFFAESTFLGLWVFGWGRLRPRVHVTLIWLVTLTAYASAYWIMVANGFLQNPVGHEIRGGTAYLTDFGALLTNPNALLALGHIVFAALLVGGLFLAGVSALHHARGREPTGSIDRAVHRTSARLGVATAAAVGYVVYTFGGLQYPQLAATQPMKLAALEPGPELDALAAELAGRYGGSPGDYLPPAYAVTAQYMMLYLGYALFIIAVAAFLVVFRSSLLRRRWVGALVVAVAALPVGKYASALAHDGEAGPDPLPWILGALAGLAALLIGGRRIASVRPLAWVMVAVVPLPFLAAIGGWLFREGGRQPWLVYGRLTTAEAVSPVSAASMLFSLVVFLAVLLTLVVADVVLLVRFARRGPDGTHLGTPDTVPNSPAGLPDSVSGGTGANY